MIASAWQGGSGTYGVRVSRIDRDTFFERDWTSVTLELDGAEPAHVPITASFWDNCTELRSPAVRDWLRAKNLSPWPPRHPPRLLMDRTGRGRFAVRVAP